MSLPRYPRYKDSGVPWLGEVPEHWRVSALKRIARLQSGDSITTDGIEESGAYPVFGGNGLRGYTAQFTHDGEYVLIGRQGALCGNINYARGKFWASEHAVVVSPIERVQLVFLGELLRTMNLNQYSVSAAQPGLSVDVIKNLPIVLPPPPEQAYIATFLNHEINKIDALVQEQRRLIELLKEKRQVVISHAVTKGLNPGAPMKDSGIEWIGVIPEHWTILPLKRDVELLTSGSRGWAGNYADEGDLFIRIGNLTRDGLDLDLSDVQRVQVPEGTEGARTAVRAGDLLFSITAYLGSVAVAPDGLGASYVSQHVALARLANMRLTSRWVGYLTLSDVGRNYLSSQGYGGTKIQLGLGDIAGLLSTTPPLPEQALITEFLDRQCQRFAQLAYEANETIKLLQEHRTALITAAVTGKIDVRSAVAEVVA